MEDLEPVLNYPQSEEELQEKLLNVTLELEAMKNVKDELFDLLMLAYGERDEARAELQKVMNKSMPSNTSHLQSIFGCVQHENHYMFPAAKANSSITESNSLSHGSPPVDSFFETVSSPEFSNINNNNNNNNLSYSNLNQHLVPGFNNISASHDAANAIIDSIAKVRPLPQKGKLLEAVMDAGPLLQNVLLAGPIPTWRNPPPLQHIKVPPLTIKEYDTTNNTATDLTSLYLKPKLPSNATLSCSSSLLNSSYFKYARHLNSSASTQFPSRKRQRHQ
ncbi:hypothetical protein Lal_00034313 [Lupinus albus]|uniref:Uncharacterized protein n=1 Tax=Lupinus albus TaxID=3870 RepID=A0A6A5PHN9_LUPAL|nr:hypothetical protein Lalb_Chr03g0026881 [Lupinus albus]KAF1896614.1 hypothetical protein Lal_00034313 [Lupinus albus]